MESAAGARKPRVNLFFALTALFWFTNYAYMPTFTPYLKSIGTSYAVIGAIGGAYGLAQMLLRVPVGILSDRLRRRRIFVVSGALFGAVSSFLLFCVTDPALIWALRFMAGLSASSWVVYTVLFASYFGGDKTASRISILNLANTLGVMAAKMLGSAAVALWGYRAGFLLSAAVGLVSVGMSFFVTENVPASGPPPKVRELLGVIRDRNLLTMSILAVFSQMAMFSTTNIFTPEVASRLGADAMQLGILATVSSIPGVFTSVLLGWLFARRVNFRNLVTLSLGLGALGTLMTAFAPNVGTVYAASAVAGFGFGACMTALMSFCTLTVDPARRSVAMGFYQAIYSVGMFLGPMLVGGVADLLGMAAGILSAVGVAVLGVVLAFLLLGDQ